MMGQLSFTFWDALEVRLVLGSTLMVDNRAWSLVWWHGTQWWGMATAGQARLFALGARHHSRRIDRRWIPGPKPIGWHASAHWPRGAQLSLSPTALHQRCKRTSSTLWQRARL